MNMRECVNGCVRDSEITSVYETTKPVKKMKMKKSRYSTLIHAGLCEYLFRRLREHLKLYRGA
jgi:hypothetical protein